MDKVSLFSDLNNLKDITLDRRYAAICGYTEQDMDTVFADDLTGLDRGEVRRWYNGYSWRGPRVHLLGNGDEHRLRARSIQVDDSSKSLYLIQYK